MALLILLVGAAGLGPVARMAEAREGSVATTVPAEESARPIYLNGWNHTTLHALRRDKTVTYLQAAMEPDSALSLVDEVERAFAPNRLLQHLECVNFGGRVGFASLALLWPSDDDDLRSMLAWHEARMPVFDPHTYILEDGGMKQTNWAQLEFKREADPHLLLNCGKMRAAFEEEAVVAGDAGPMAAAYRLGTKPPPPPQTISKRTSRYWSDWTTKDFATADLSDAVAVLPIGAIEAHGPHLPLGTDALLNVGLLSRAVDLLPDDAKVLVLPPQEIGVSCEHTAFAGTLQISSETAIRAWFEIAQCVARAGVRKIVIYNSHGGNQALAEVLARKIRLELNMLCVLAMNLGCGMDKVQHLFPAEEFRYGIHGTCFSCDLAPASSRWGDRDFAHDRDSAGPRPHGGRRGLCQLGRRAPSRFATSDSPAWLLTQSRLALPRPQSGRRRWGGGYAVRQSQGHCSDESRGRCLCRPSRRSLSR